MNIYIEININLTKQIHRYEFKKYFQNWSGNHDDQWAQPNLFYRHVYGDGEYGNVTFLVNYRSIYGGYFFSDGTHCMENC